MIFKKKEEIPTISQEEFIANMRKQISKKVCFQKLLERLKNRDLLRKAREKKIRKAARRMKEIGMEKKRKFIGTVIDINPWHCEFVPGKEEA